MIYDENQEPMDEDFQSSAADQPANDMEPTDAIEPDGQPIDTATEVLHDQTVVSGLYQTYFLDYASYVILERAVPAVEDGFITLLPPLSAIYSSLLSLLSLTVWGGCLGLLAPFQSFL
jgi:hypothetical protein